MSNIKITPGTVTAFNTPVETAAAAATSTVANAAEVFEVTFVGKPSKVALIFSNAASNGAYTYSIAAGGILAFSANAVTGSITEGKTELVQIETGGLINSDGKILITITPATGKKTLTDHAATIRALNLI